jgi:hypothetical protein
MRTSRAALALVVVLAGTSCGRSSAAQKEHVSFVQPRNGDTVRRPVHVVMRAEQFKIEPTGAARKGAGHFHIMIDTGCVRAGEAIPFGGDHAHFGKAQTSADIELGPGKHTLCLQLGNGVHAALDLTDTITVTVQS